MFWIFWKHYLDNGRQEAVKERRSISAPPQSPLSIDVSARLASFGNDVFCIADESLNFIYVSENWETVSGLHSRKNLASGLKERILPEYLAQIQQYLSDADGNAPAVRFQINLDTSIRWFELKLALAEQDEAGNIHYKCLLRDVDELVNLQADYERYKLEADLATKSRSEFLANMNHELRTPLNAIIGFAQMMENTVFGELGHPKYSEYINNIQASGQTLLSKVNDLIDIANIDSGRMVLNEMETDLVPIIHQAIALQSHRALEGRITLRENLPDKPLPAVIDRIRIVQALINVISNAIKYNSAGGTVDIYCENRKDGGVNIVIEDNGNGISATRLKKINSAFEQDNSFFARTRDCAGIGLALSKEIVKLHQGKIEIKSEPDKGTLLKIMLPAERIRKKAAAKNNIALVE